MSILKRKRDLVYLLFFVVHVVVMLAFDLTSYYPPSLKPAWMTEIRTWYHAKYGDRFFDPGASVPPFFPLYTLLELTLHLPLSLWLIPALLRNDPRLPLAMLVFGLETAMSTVTCLVEMWSWGELTLFMTVDSYARLDRIIAKSKGLEPVTKKDL
ncbi:hypothetical protein CC78DRAFT_580826 [Lojkania enalia]|uniref:EXPERA domain-containing protein n=1 Tax=Lojkania enalia TaxID=147567 RepID=A0A9P4K7L0_9PLEO|nr:hypothetical protein CC78DRAFT_580826 [Didymosphaeria enalia]